MPSLTGGAGGSAGASSGTSNNGISDPFNTPFNFDNSGWIVTMKGNNTGSASGSTNANGTTQTATPSASSSGSGASASQQPYGGIVGAGTQAVNASYPGTQSAMGSSHGMSGVMIIALAIGAYVMLAGKL